MKTGIELIAQERQEQVEKHGRTVEYDKQENKYGELIRAAVAILDHDHQPWPSRWDMATYIKINDKKWKERLIIAGALIAAEIDRIQNTE